MTPPWPHAYPKDALERRLEKRRNATPGGRHEFARDRDRVVYSSAFRRLAGKTQVVHSAEAGAFHTRLTHTLKVAQIGRRLAEAIQFKYYRRSEGPPLTGIGVCDPDLVEMACLAHDLGHPPFGHIGERSLSDAFDRLAERGMPRPNSHRSPDDLRRDTSSYCAQLGGFEGNAQTFRIVSYLSVRGDWDTDTSGNPADQLNTEPAFFGLNLTRAGLEATVKYPTLRTVEGPGAGKWGVFPEDEAAAQWLWNSTKPWPAQRTFEADVMNWADDVAYAVHDVIDFFCARLIPLQLYFPSYYNAEEQPPDEALALFQAIATRKQQYSAEVLQEAWFDLVPILAMLPSDWTQSRRDKALAQRATSDLIEYFVKDVTWNSGGIPLLREGVFRVATKKADQVRKHAACYLLKELVHKHVIRAPSLISQQIGQQRLVSFLLETYFERADDLLPDDRREELSQHGMRLRSSADFVASLTEADAYRLARRLRGLDPGFITDRM